MNSPRVIELPRRLEAVSRDPFLERDAEIVPLRQPAQPGEPQPPLRAA
jgi:hypothetical protein